MTFFKVFALHATITLLMPIAKFDRVRRWLKRRRSPNARCGAKTSEQLAATVVRTSRWIPGTSCLTEALCCHHLLRVNDFNASLVIGLERQGTGNLQAHAWVELDDVVVLGDNGRLDVYTPLENGKRR